ncbi:uncharacterized protein LOC107800378 isoform X1 [Nicotiana tabacum]|uniref:Uncharacterized protein LOC107800378 isoform X1 n=4 Tax=Nicotiana tabacum TaxID=4097 RepID=A0A1S4AR37_TOBAC|nr:PREDICTED: uncharacterized protein LOC107800378 isoform X1 [Nicotiana tabacum]
MNLNRQLPAQLHLMKLLNLVINTTWPTTSCSFLIRNLILFLKILFAVLRIFCRMDESIINLIVFGVVSWTTLFLLTRKIFPNRSFDFCNRLVSTVHAILAVTLASISVQDWSGPISPLASRSTTKQVFCIGIFFLIIFSSLALMVMFEKTEQMRAIAVSVAYLIYDFVCCLFDKQVKIDNLIHHLVSAVGLGAGLYYEWCGSEMVAALWLTEISSPFLHLREILKELGYKDTDLNLAADVLFAVIFSCARMVGGPYLTYVTLSADNPILIKAMAFGLQLVSAFWFYKIARMIMYKFSRRTKAKTVPSNM